MLRKMPILSKKVNGRTSSWWKEDLKVRNLISWMDSRHFLTPTAEKYYRNNKYLIPYLKSAVHLTLEHTEWPPPTSITYTNSFLSMMKSSAADTVLKHWLIVMKKRTPILVERRSKTSSLSLSVALLQHFHVMFHKYYTYWFQVSEERKGTHII